MLRVNSEDLEILTIIKRTQKPDCSQLTKSLLKKYEVVEVYEYWQFFEKICMMWSASRLLDDNEE